METIIDTEAVTLFYHPEKRIVHHQIRRFLHGDEFRNLLEQGLEVLRKRGATKWLSDNRGNGPVKPSDAEWALNDWAPRVMAAGWRYWAIVMPEKILGEMNMRRWMERYAAMGLTSEAFTDPEEAMTWLQGQ